MPSIRMAQVVESLRGLDGAGLADAERIDLIALLEQVKGVAAAAQARLTAAFVESQCAGGDGSREEQARLRRSAGSQVALARRVPPSEGDRCVGLARALLHELPHTMRALEAGEIGERSAIQVTQATAATELGVRREVDQRLAADRGGLRSLSPRQVGRAARRVVAELDAAGVVARNERAVASRRVMVRPAPDGMAYLTVLGPLPEAVGAYAALRAHAASVIAGHGPDGETAADTSTGATRGTGAVMADAALRLLSGRRWGEAQPVAVQLVMTDRSLTGIGDPGRSTMEPARLVGHESVPAPTARRWLRDNPQAPDAARVWVRRIFTTPDGRDLMALESRAALFPPPLADFLVLRDDVCGTPYCDAPITQSDHVVSRARGGATTAVNGQGKCARCNLTKETVGWWARPRPVHADGAGHAVSITTPTGRTYDAMAPPVMGLGWSPPRRTALHEALDAIDWAPFHAAHPGWRIPAARSA